MFPLGLYIGGLADVKLWSGRLRAGGYPTRSKIPGIDDAGCWLFLGLEQVKRSGKLGREGKSIPAGPGANTELISKCT